mmetsp:Transcript_22313/g.75445  ORF Transcript_22313/g.75445 Transcript_22313/m.75445 type:complete len:222 (-) Transcript_22313:1064-1729(-)
MPLGSRTALLCRQNALRLRHQNAVGVHQRLERRLRLAHDEHRAAAPHAPRAEAAEEAAEARLRVQMLGRVHDAAEPAGAARDARVLLHQRGDDVRRLRQRRGELARDDGGARRRGHLVLAEILGVFLQRLLDVGRDAEEPTGPGGLARDRGDVAAEEGREAAVEAPQVADHGGEALPRRLLRDHDHLRRRHDETGDDAGESRGDDLGRDVVGRLLGDVPAE